MTANGYKSPRSHPRPSAVAIIGVLGIVIFSVGLGVLGPQIVRRNSMEVGLPLSTLLDKVHVFYQTEEFLRFRSSLDRNRESDSEDLPEDAEVREALESMFGNDRAFLPIDSPNLRLVAVQRDVEIDLFDQPGLAVIYQEQLPDQSQVRAANTMVLYMPHRDGLQDLFARNEFGVPELLERGELVLRRISQGGVETWIIFWYDGELMHFLIAPSEQMIDRILDNTGLPEPVEASSSSA